ncbi:unnamed protein product, partial [Musa acuminata subsp. burmannicoides]
PDTFGCVNLLVLNDTSLWSKFQAVVISLLQPFTYRQVSFRLIRIIIRKL